MFSDTEVPPMRLYIIRHGKADQDSPTGRDADRPLKPRGVRQAKFLGKCLADTLGEKRSPVILSSGFARAIHTATIIQASLNCPLDTAPALECDRPVQGALDLIGDHARIGPSGQRPLLLVGHNPQLGELLAALLPSGQSGDTLVLRTGECVALEVRPNQLIGGAKIVARLRLEEDEEEIPALAAAEMRRPRRA